MKYDMPTQVSFVFDTLLCSIMGTGTMHCAASGLSLGRQVRNTYVGSIASGRQAAEQTWLPNLLCNGFLIHVIDSPFVVLPWLRGGADCRLLDHNFQ
jgi:hypothetical protein